MSKLTDSVAEALESTVAELGYELIEVRYGSEYGRNTLTVFIDRPEGIGLDDCERVSLAIDPILDDMDPTGGAPYDLNVSSAGLDRPIRTDRDYARNAGREVEVKLFAPLPGTKSKRVTGTLIGAEGDRAVIRTEDGSDLTLERSAIALMTRRIDF